MLLARVLPLSACFFCAVSLYAQVDTGTILGTVHDNTGAVIAGAKVTVRDEGTSRSQTNTTSASGEYVFTPLKIGTYTIEVENAGFKKERRTGLTVNIQQQVVADFSLSVGDVTSEIEVTAAVPLLQTESGSVGHVIEGKTINDLPLNGRNYTFLARLVPGATVGQPEGRGLERQRLVHRQRYASRAEQLHARRHRQQHQQRRFPQRRGLRAQAAHRRHRRVQAADKFFQRRIRARRRRCAQCKHQIRQQQFSWQRLGVSAQRQTRRH